VPALFGVLALSGLTGCEALGLEDDDKRDRDSEPTRGSERISRDDPDDRTTSSRGGGMSEIPPKARRLESVHGARFTETFDNDGRLYVFDHDDDRLIYSARVRENERFVFDPAEDEMRLNDKRVGPDDLNLRSAHRYEFYFEEE
jgi:hypothetical protein